MTTTSRVRQTESDLCPSPPVEAKAKSRVRRASSWSGPTSASSVGRLSRLVTRCVIVTREPSSNLISSSFCKLLPGAALSTGAVKLTWSWSLRNSHRRIVREISAFDLRPYPETVSAVEPEFMSTGQARLFRHFVKDIFAADECVRYDPRTHISQNHKFDRGV